jgi:hypothetical protein
MCFFSFRRTIRISRNGDFPTSEKPVKPQVRGLFVTKSGLDRTALIMHAEGR